MARFPGSNESRFYHSEKSASHSTAPRREPIPPGLEQVTESKLPAMLALVSSNCMSFVPARGVLWDDGQTYRGCTSSHRGEEGCFMLRLAILFLFIALVTWLLGLDGIAGLIFEA